VAENLELGALSVHGAREDELPRARALVYQLFPQLHDRQRQPARTLSGGEQQMLAIARAMMGLHHDVPRDRQPHASASLPARVERLEDPLRELRGNPGSVVREYEIAGIPTRRGFVADLRVPYAMKPFK
jgi:ABC-type polar amino acid transport system ATPase subunit